MATGSEENQAARSIERLPLVAQSSGLVPGRVSGGPLQRRCREEPHRRPDVEDPQLREWHTNNLSRLPSLKFMRTLWVCNISGGPFQYTPTKPGTTPLGLEEAHRDLRISPAEFDEVAAELGRTLNSVNVPQREKAEVLAAFAAHKNEVTAGYNAKHG